VVLKYNRIGGVDLTQRHSDGVIQRIELVGTKPSQVQEEVKTLKESAELRIRCKKVEFKPGDEYIENFGPRDIVESNGNGYPSIAPHVGLSLRFKLRNELSPSKNAPSSPLVEQLPPPYEQAFHKELWRYLL
jgi:hypothetical protein